MLSALAAAFQLPPSPAGCSHCRVEAEFISDSDWEPPQDLSGVREASREGGLTPDETGRLLAAIQDSARKKGSFMVTVTDGAMLDMAHNMIRSLDAVPCHAPRLVIGLGSNLCSKFEGDPGTTCVEVFRDATSEDEVDWGSHDYWQVVFRKHVVLTVVAMSQMARHVIYTDPDIVFLDCPVAFLVHAYKSTHDIVFSPNNMLDPQATSVAEVAETYGTRGMAKIVIGPHSRHVDINTGLFLMSSSSRVADLMLKTMRIFKEQEFVHGHYQQYSLVKALDEIPDLLIGVADGNKLVNGNVFWGHRELLKPTEVIAVHANWMRSNLKVPCLKAAGLWVDDGSPRRLSRERWVASPVTRMDAKHATVEACGVEAQQPAMPTRPGCHLWLPSGCPGRKFDAQRRWRWMEDLKDPDKCQVQARAMYNEWCGTRDAVTLFIAPPANAPAEPGEAGCYVWMPSGCEKQRFHAQTSWRQASASDYPTQDFCAHKAPSKFNAWCDTKDAQALWVPAAPAAPSAPGCYAWLPTGCKNHPSSNAPHWIRDVWGERNSNAHSDRHSCEQKRKSQIEAWCGISNAKLLLVQGA